MMVQCCECGREVERIMPRRNIRCEQCKRAKRMKQQRVRRERDDRKKMIDVPPDLMQALETRDHEWLRKRIDGKV